VNLKELKKIPVVTRLNGLLRGDIAARTLQRSSGQGQCASVTSSPDALERSVAGFCILRFVGRNAWHHSHNGAWHSTGPFECLYDITGLFVCLFFGKFFHNVLWI